MSEVKKRPRLYFVDNLRILLIILVVLWHLAITYGAGGAWPYRESRADTATSMVYTVFSVINSPYVLGFFFLIAGYFTPRSLDRRGPARFAGDRLLRLGVPLMFYVLVFDPLIAYGVRAFAGGYSGSFWEYWRVHFLGYRSLGVGPMWFAELLLIFSLLYSLVRAVWRNPAESRSDPFPSNLALSLFALAVGLATFGLRIWRPIGSILEPLGMPVYQLPLHAALFVAGLMASRRGWLDALPDRTGKVWAAVAAVLIVVVMPLLFYLGGALEGSESQFLGGLHWQALANAIWEQYVAVGMILALLVLFRNRFSRQGRMAKAMSDSTFAVYFIHAPVIVYLALALRGIDLHPLVKYLLVAPVAVSLCFLIAYGVRQLPLVRRVL
jgi:fucose 4-O-acetylase-like acetyltransferase